MSGTALSATMVPLKTLQWYRFSAMGKVFAEDLHGEGDGATMGPTGKALEGVFAYLEGEAGVLVTVERAEGFVLLDFQAEVCCYLLDGEFT